MTNEEAIEILNGIAPMPRRCDGKSTTHLLVMEALEMAIKALEQEPCEDCISREALMKLFKEYQPSLAVRVCEFGDALEELPSVKPQLNKS